MTNRKRIRALLVEDSTFDADYMVTWLKAEGYDPLWERVDTASALEAALNRSKWDVVISDHLMPELDALQAIRLAKAKDPNLPVVVVSGSIGENLAAQILKAGADDYLLKDRLQRLPEAIREAMAGAAARRERELAQQLLHQSEARFRNLAGSVPGMVFEFVRDAGRCGRFAFVSDGAYLLLGLDAQALLEDPRRFTSLLLPEDQASFFAAMDDSAAQLQPCNWEGRIRPTYSEEVKWINLRASPRREDGDCVAWSGIITNITRNKMLELEAKRSRDQLQELSAHIAQVKEDEGARIAREIHDDIGGTLTAIRMELAWLVNHTPPRRMDLLGKVSSIQILVDRLIEATGRIARDLRPAVLDFGLFPALEWLGSEFEARTGIACRVSSEPENLDLDGAMATALFRIFQEALTNVAKHAGATELQSGLFLRDGGIVLEVSDNGRGISRADLAKPNSFGIRGIQERCRALGGRASIEGRAGHGSTLSAWIPLAGAPGPVAAAAAPVPAQTRQP